MTREEAVIHVETLRTVIKDIPKYSGKAIDEAFDMAIKALENNDVLDKIRAEIIERDRTVKTVRSDGCCFFIVEEILEIIDKYKAESEVQDADSN